MKRMIGTLAVCLLAICSQAQSAGKTDPSSKKTVGFVENFDQAKKEAVAFKQPIFALFTGSDWCPWCVRLHTEILEKAAFKTYAAGNLILFEADFPRAKKQSSEIKNQNQSLAQRYGVEGFPTVVLMDASGKELGRTGYERGGADAYVASLKDLLKKAGVKTEGATVSASSSADKK